jgi:hypothetical protein
VKNELYYIQNLNSISQEYKNIIKYNQERNKKNIDDKIIIAYVEEIKADAIASVQSPHTQESNTLNVGIAWNYSGSINKYPIKAQINYGEGINSEGTGALQIPITGYYFYESQNTKIPLEGTCYGSGIIYFVAHTSGGYETFDGSFTRSIGDDFSGTWTKGNKKLNFYLNSK